MAERKPAYRIAVFASGSGSNFQAIVDAVACKELDVQIELLVCDRPQAYVVERAKQAEVPVFAFKPKEYPNRQAYEKEILQQLEERGIQLIVLAGYMRIVTNVLVDAFAGRMINIHPSLLPSFPGVDGIGQALAYGVKITGVTVHYVDGGLDSGPIITQQVVAILAGDTIETLSERMHAVEHELFPQVIGWISEGRVKLEGRQVTITA
ncbi:phosphoribosylglycinamide formyltransferase [Paenibacillus albiflavus]|uniref:Phosphoribosylglycinamide formyltransferase n=1 Tax=Paenibacillus albiflavus TaxID=2545760 RepID=A0A4R4EEK3_9BACL|nr:phosphoribosylglycinamide formyltransferase [Paenibacillus albiflavus]TCZ78446.1 phosphoribosylglycinamide formyltransferase [Paenibacillus albiflavus]